MEGVSSKQANKKSIPEARYRNEKSLITKKTTVKLQYFY